MHFAAKQCSLIPEQVGLKLNGFEPGQLSN